MRLLQNHLLGLLYSLLLQDSSLLCVLLCIVPALDLVMIVENLPFQKILVHLVCSVNHPF